MADDPIDKERVKAADRQQDELFYEITREQNEAPIVVAEASSSSTVAPGPQVDPHPTDGEMDVDNMENSGGGATDLVGSLIRVSDDIQQGKYESHQKGLVNVLMNLGKSRVQARALVSEMYSVPRVMQQAPRQRHLNISGGVSYELRTNDEAGRPWDFKLCRPAG